MCTTEQFDKEMMSRCLDCCLYILMSHYHFEKKKNIMKSISIFEENFFGKTEDLSNQALCNFFLFP